MEQPSSSQPDNGSTGAQELPLQPGPAILSADAVQDHSHTDYPVSQEQPTLPATAETALGDTSSKAQHDNTTNERAPNSQEHPQAATEAIAAPGQ